VYQLYYYPLNASMAPHFVLEALGVDYELILVDRTAQGQKSPAYLALNPAGRIPTLVDGERVICESPAICMHLAESHPDANLIPAIGSESRADFLQWMMFLTNTLQSHMMVMFYPEKYTSEPQAAATIIAKQEQAITLIFERLDDELKDKMYLCGEQLSVCDFFLFMLAVWGDEIEKPPLAFTHLGRYLRLLAQHKAIVRVCEKENLSLADYGVQA